MSRSGTQAPIAGVTSAQKLLLSSNYIPDTMKSTLFMLHLDLSV